MSRKPEWKENQRVAKGNKLTVQRPRSYSGDNPNESVNRTNKSDKETPGLGPFIRELDKIDKHDPNMRRRRGTRKQQDI